MKARFDFSGTTVLVTGASRGIGFGIAEGFAETGAELIILAETEEIHEAAAQLPGRVRSLLCDVTDRNAVGAALSELRRIDVLVNNAGLEKPTPLNEGMEPAALAARLLEINVGGMETVTRAALPIMPNGGRIILTSSIWGKTAVPEFSGYVASKHAVIGLARTWALELGKRNINVNAVCPGWVRTIAATNSLRAMSQRRGKSVDVLLEEIIGSQALPGLMEPSDVAGLYLFLASEAAANITGQAICIDRGETLA